MKKYLFCLIAAVAVSGQIHAQDTSGIKSVQYWIDENHTSAKVGSEMEFDVDCSALSQGSHTLHYRFADDDGKYSPLYSHSFMKITVPAKPTKVSTLQYWWDDMTSNAVTAPYSGEDFVLSTTALTNGLHSLKYRVKDDTGRWSALLCHYFYKNEVADSARIVSYSYWWNDLADKTTTAILETPAATFVLDEDFTVPEEAKTGYAGHYTATLNVVFTDNRGRTAFSSTNVKYPDNDAPATDIDADNYVTSSTVKLTWSESTNDLMGDYNVYFSRDNGPFILWLADTKLTSSTFKGERGSMYLFTVTGRDAFGNREKYDETKCVSVTFE